MSPLVLGAVAVGTTSAGLLFFLRPRLLRSDSWRATATPLASIIGSGFLVSVPILSDIAGRWAVFGVAALLLVAYAVGGAIRDNIAHVEPLMNNHGASTHLASIERLSHLVLAFAYFVSVAYYLMLFATFFLKPLDVSDEVAAKTIVTCILAGIGAVGLWRGFRAVERIEVFAVSAKLAVIAGLIAAIALYDGQGLVTHPDGISGEPGHFALGSVPVVLGLLILVQGFETSRFLGTEYPAELRIRTMRRAQIYSAAIYVAFFILMIPLQGGAHGGEGVAAIVDMVRPVSIALPILILLGALTSQSSAAMADALGAGGLLHDVLGGRISVRHTYPLIALVAAVITWETNVYSLITLASRCFALYYGLQCVVATLSARRRGAPRRAAWYAALALVCTAVVVFGIPAEGG